MRLIFQPRSQGFYVLNQSLREKPWNEVDSFLTTISFPIKFKSTEFAKGVLIHYQLFINWLFTDLSKDCFIKIVPTVPVFELLVNLEYSSPFLKERNKHK